MRVMRVENTYTPCYGHLCVYQPWYTRFHRKTSEKTLFLTLFGGLPPAEASRHRRSAAQNVPRTEYFPMVKTACKSEHSLESYPRFGAKWASGAIKNCPVTVTRQFSWCWRPIWHQIVDNFPTDARIYKRFSPLDSPRCGACLERPRGVPAGLSRR